MNANIETILREFGSENRIFQSEAQFQFDLARKLEESLTDDEQIILEMLSDTYEASNGKTMRCYSDIIIRNKKTLDFIVIELKYKTKNGTYNETFYGNVTLLNHAAANLGRFDYIWDIYRIEELKKRSEKEQPQNGLGCFKRGYAVILTNDSRYWKDSKAKCNPARLPADHAFRIGEADEISGELSWGEQMKSVKGTKRDEEIQLEGTYVCHWKSYCEDFRYLISEINIMTAQVNKGGRNSIT